MQSESISSAGVSAGPGGGAASAVAAPTAGFAARLILLTALSVSIGWGIRGNFGHEQGAMIAGALGGMGAVLLAGREDWWRRVAYFGLFGAIGWSFGGSISYMQVISYTHSGHSPSVLYGFACLFVIGFLWAAMGGGFTALPALLSRERLTEFFVPGIAVYAAIIVQDWFYDALNVWLGGVLGHTYLSRGADYRQDEPLYWFDTSWTTVLLAIGVLLVLALIRRRIDRASAFLLHMLVGWWVGFLLFPVLLGIRMTPPRGDSWAGCVGMVGGMWVFFQRNRLQGATLASVVTGFIGGLGFAGATLFKLIEVKSGFDTNWHSILEQSYGLINGIGVAVAVLMLAPRAARVSDDRSVRRWADILAPAGVMLGVTYLNMRQNPENWVKQKAMPDVMYGISAYAWYSIAWLAFSAAVIYLMWRHQRSPLPIVPASWLGRGQMLYLVFLWIMVTGNFERAVTGFAPQRLVTEGVIHLNAVLCTLLVLLWPAVVRNGQTAEEEPATVWRPLLRRSVGIGLAGSAALIVLSWGIVRGIYGDTFAGYSGKHIRFGPNATTAPPKKGQPHP